MPSYLFFLGSIEFAHGIRDKWYRLHGFCGGMITLTAFSKILNRIEETIPQILGRVQRFMQSVMQN
jgi:hypothetical protein